MTLARTDRSNHRRLLCRGLLVLLAGGCKSAELEPSPAIELRADEPADLRSERPSGRPNFGSDVLALGDFDGDGVRDVATLITYEFGEPSSGCTVVVHSGATGEALAHGASPYRVTTMRLRSAAEWLWTPAAGLDESGTITIGMIVAGEHEQRGAEAHAALLSLPSREVLAQGIVRGTVLPVRCRRGGGGAIVEQRDERAGEWVYRELRADLSLGDVWARSAQRVLAAAEHEGLRGIVTENASGAVQLVTGRAQGAWGSIEIPFVEGRNLANHCRILQLYVAPDRGQWALVGMNERHSLELFDVSAARLCRTIASDGIRGLDASRLDARGFANSAALLQDADGDGVPELAIGWPPGSMPYGGSLLGVSGAEPRELWLESFDWALWSVGTAMAVGPDWDSDGLEDVLVSSFPVDDSGLSPVHGCGWGNLLLLSSRTGESLRQIPEVAYPLR